MPVVVMVVAIIIVMFFFMVILVMVMVMMHMCRPGMRLIFHVEAKNGVHGRHTIRHRNDRRRRLKPRFDSRARARLRVII